MILSREVVVGILLALLIAGTVGGINYWKKYQEERLDELSALVYEFEKGRLSKEEVWKEVVGTPLEPYFLLISSGDLSEVLGSLRDKDMSSLFKEKYAHQTYKSGDASKALNLLEGIGKESFNYPSALLLRAVIYEETEKIDEAKNIYRELLRNFEGTYFGRIAYGFLLSSE